MLTDPANGEVELTGTTFESTATYSCDANYDLDGGDEMRTCMGNMQWSGAAPNCVCK